MAEDYLEEKRMIQIYVRGLGKVDIESLAETINHKQMTHLNLAGNGMDCNSLRSVTDVLKYSQITSLVLDDNKIGCDGLKYLAGVLKDTQITHLSLRNSNIGNDGFIYLAKTLNGAKMKELNLEANDIDLEGNTSYLTATLKLTQMTRLNLRNNKITCNGLKHLANILKDSKISDLDLSNNNLRDNGVKYLSDYLKDTQLKKINLRYNKFGFEAAEYFNRQLKYTTLNSILLDTSLDIYDAENEKQLITHCNSIIYLYGSNIGSAGSRYISEFFCEKGISTLEFLFNFHECTDDDIYYLSQAFSSIKIQILILLPDYFTQTYNVDYLVKIFEKSHIGYFSTYSKFIVSDIHYLTRFLKKVNVFELNISNNYLTDESIKTLAPALKNNDIMHIDLSGNYNITSEGAKYLSEILQNSKIVGINLCNCDIGIEGAKHLANGLPHSQVTAIHLHGNRIEYEGYQALIDVVDDTNISWVNLHRNNIEAGMDGEKLWPYNIPRNTTTVAYSIEKAFRNLVSLSSNGEELEFIVPDKENHCYSPIDIHQYAFLIGTLKKTPNSKVHIIYKIYREPWNYDFDAIHKMDNFIRNITNNFILFFESKLTDLLVRFSDDDYIHFVKQFEEFELHDIVQRLLLHRVLYYVDENQEILHPYIYKLLNQYNLPLYNSQLEPNKKKEIMSYYENHKEIDGAQEIIDMLESMVL